jgi:hypothetical protein
MDVRCSSWVLAVYLSSDDWEESERDQDATSDGYGEQEGVPCLAACVGLGGRDRGRVQWTSCRRSEAGRGSFGGLS